MLEFNATFLVAMFSFVVFIFIMNAIFYNPILGIIRKRDEYINSNYENAKNFEVQADELRSTHSAEIEQTQNRCRHEFKKVVSVAHNEANQKISQARDNMKKLVQDKKDAIVSEGISVKNEVKNNIVKDLASSIVSKVLDEESIVSEIDCDIVNRIMD